MALAEDSDRDAWLRLTLINGLGGASIRQLLSAFGTPQQVFDAGALELRRHVAAEIAAVITAGGNQDAARKTLDWLQDPANHIVTLGDEDYPKLLLQIPDPPPLLYVKGRLDLLNRFAVAIVGSRNASPQGLDLARDFARALAEAGVTVISGLALGIDGAAHQGALPTAPEGPARCRVHVGKGGKDQKHHPHGMDFAAEPPANNRVSELVDGLDED